MPHRLRRMLRWWPLGVICLLVGASFLLRTRSKPVALGPETTHALGPINAGGEIDYEAALNEKLSEGITPEENANVLIVKALGPHPEGKPLPASYYAWLGIEPLSQEGNYFQRWWKYADANWKLPPPERAQELDTEEKWREIRNQRFERTFRHPWKASDEPEVVRWLKQNEAPLALLAGLPTRPRYYNPIVSRPEDPRPRLMQVASPTSSVSRDLAEALFCRAMLALGEGHPDEAWRDLLLSQQLGYRVAQGGLSIEVLQGMQIIHHTMEAQSVLLSHASPSSPRFKKWLADLQALPPLTLDASRYSLFDRYMLLQIVQMAAEGNRSDRRELVKSLKGLTGNCTETTWERVVTRSLDYTPVFRQMNAHFDRLVEIADKPQTQRHQEYAQIKEELREAQGSIGFFSYWFLGDTAFAQKVTESLLSNFSPIIGKVCDRFERTQQAQQNLQIAFALAIFRAEKGRYPATLNELAPSYLPEVPSDLFTGKPLTYRPSAEGYLLYSVGPNEEDNEGMGDDVAIQLPLPPLEEPQ
jgi:hypothetical protein